MNAKNHHCFPRVVNSTWRPTRTFSGVGWELANRGLSEALVVLKYPQGRDWSLLPTKGGTKQVRVVQAKAPSFSILFLGGHAMIAPFLGEGCMLVVWHGQRQSRDHLFWKWTESNTCWWCGKRFRQSREHLFRGCMSWKGETRRPWKEV